jgi:tripartite-type tricarboxylate transporter receptor subunit TctC
MKLKRTVMATFAATTMAFGLAGPVLAQGFPSKPITIVIPFPPGGLTDQVARVVAQKLQDSLGKPVIVDNKPGAGGQIAGTQVMRAEADGHTLYIGDTGALAINQGLYKKFSYDPLKDFQPVTALVSSPLILVVPKDSPANSVPELIALAKKKPEGLNYASQGIGTIGHLLGELFRSRTDIKMNHIAYKGSAPALNDVMGGQIDLLFDPVITASPLVAGGKLKALAIAAPKASPVLPKLPTLAASGTTGVEASVWFGMVVKAGTPEATIKKLNEEVVKALKSPDVTKRFNDQGLDIAAMTPAEFGSFMKAEAERWAPIVKASGATVE